MRDQYRSLVAVLPIGQVNHCCHENSLYTRQKSNYLSLYLSLCGSAVLRLPHPPPSNDLSSVKLGAHSRAIRPVATKETHSLYSSSVTPQRITVLLLTPSLSSLVLLASVGICYIPLCRHYLVNVFCFCHPTLSRFLHFLAGFRASHPHSAFPLPHPTRRISSHLI